MSEFAAYQSPFSWRYGGEAMRQLWSEEHKRRLWRRIWLNLAEVQSEYGLVSADQVADLRAHVDKIDVERALEIEAHIHHDLMAELKSYAEQCLVGGGVLHLGATAMDIEDNADALRIRQALDLLLESLHGVLGQFADAIERWHSEAVIAFTHLQPAEPTTLGYRLAVYAQDLLADRKALQRIRDEIRGKGFKGAVGSGAGFVELVGAERFPAFEARLMAHLELSAYPVTTQTYPRKQEYTLVSALAGLGGTLYKFAFDLRVLQSPPFGELREPFGARQVGSSAMPFKRNPIRAEKIDSLARYLAQLPRVAWDNAAHSLLERTLDDSANRRSMLPEAFLICDELLSVTAETLAGLEVDEVAIAHNLAVYGPFAATERVLMGLGKSGADRQEMHERLRSHALAAWEAVQRGEPNPLPESICSDPAFQRYLSDAQLRSLLDIDEYLGDAPGRALEMAATIRRLLKDGG